jgi:aminodeoxyfutalosine synthase
LVIGLYKDFTDINFCMMNSTIHFRDSLLHPIWEKIRNGDRLSLQDGVTMFASSDVISIGKMAHAVQQMKSGDAVYYVVNQKIEPTNICILACTFCDFAVKQNSPQAYEMTIQEILAKLNSDVHEVHITGGLHPDWPWEYYVGMVRDIKKAFPQIDVKAFTAVEIDFFHKKFKMPIEEVLRQLYAAGLRTMPGGGAEVFSERVRKLLFNQKIGAKTWFEVHTTAHRLGIPSNATLLYGHIETYEERVGHLIKLREAQDETHGFLSFIPLAFQPGDTGIKPRNEFTSAIEDLKTIAISRLMLDNVPHIKAYWVMLTEEVASVALNFGADDMDGTVGGEKIAHDAGAISPMTMAKEKLVKIINDAGKIPVERDVYYNALHVNTGNVIGKIPYLNSVPFYAYCEQRQFKMLPIAPRRMGVLSQNGEIDAGLFSLMDYFAQEDQLTLMDFCIASRDQVKSVILLSKEGWQGLSGKRIGIIDDTATSVRLLQVILEKKYGVKALFERMHAGVNDHSRFDAVLLIGDEALKRAKSGLPGFDLVYDLAKEWYEWQKMPFVFAVWAFKKSLPPDKALELHDIISTSLSRGEAEIDTIGAVHGSALHLTKDETAEFLQGFNYHLGEREKEAMAAFKKLIEEVEVSL